MGRPSLLKKKAAERGISVFELVDQTLAKKGSVIGAAMDLEMMPNTIWDWMRRENLRVVRVVKLARIEKGN